MITIAGLQQILSEIPDDAVEPITGRLSFDAIRCELVERTCTFSLLLKNEVVARFEARNSDLGHGGAVTLARIHGTIGAVIRR